MFPKTHGENCFCGMIQGLCGMLMKLLLGCITRDFDHGWYLDEQMNLGLPPCKLNPTCKSKQTKTRGGVRA